METPLLERIQRQLADHRLNEAEALLWDGLFDPSSARPHELWLRLGEVFASRSQLRRAVGAFRRAQEVDARGEYAFVLHTALSSLGQVLHLHHKPFLHPADDAVRTRRLLSARPPPAPVHAPLEEVVAAALALRPTLPEAGRAAVDEVVERLRPGVLDEGLSEQSLSRDLEQRAGPAAASLVEAVRAVQLAWYEALLDAEEPNPRR
jgi:hypothetical protein